MSHDIPVPLQLRLFEYAPRVVPVTTGGSCGKLRSSSLINCRRFGLGPFQERADARAAEQQCDRTN